MNELWEWVLANSLSGILNSKLFAVLTDLWEPSLSSFDGPVTNCLLQMQGAWVQFQSIFSWGPPWKPRFKSGFHNSFWDLVVPGRISWMTLEIYKWNLGTSFGNSFSGIHKSKVICSVDLWDLQASCLEIFFFFYYTACHRTSPMVRG